MLQLVIDLAEAAAMSCIWRHFGLNVVCGMDGMQWYANGMQMVCNT